MRPTFVVRVKHDGEPLAGVTVEITGPTGTNGAQVLTAETDSDGTVHMRNLAPGDYWIRAELLGISAASTCFHIADEPSPKAKGAFQFTWGDLAPATRRIAGTLVDVQPGKGGTPLWNVLHPRTVPISGAVLRVTNPITNTSARTWSDADGKFVFDGIPTGTYVLHIEGGRADERDYDATDLLVKLNPTASRDTLRLKRTEPGGGSCGGTSLELVEGE